MKRFYRSVTLGEKAESGYPLLLDDKPVCTPDKKSFLIPSESLADLVVQEWEEQGDEICPTNMPVSQMAMTLIDRVTTNRSSLTAEILDYIDTDLICYRADEPEEYRNAQAECWDPFIAWVRNHFQLDLKITYGLSPLIQDPDIHKTIADYVSGLSDSGFMSVYLATIGTGSIILGLAFQMNAFDNTEILKAAFAEEWAKDKIYLADQYGTAPDQEKKYRSLERDLNTLVYFRNI